MCTNREKDAYAPGYSEVKQNQIATFLLSISFQENNASCRQNRKKEIQQKQDEKKYSTYAYNDLKKRYVGFSCI
jgi:hypothetical protein